MVEEQRTDLRGPTSTLEIENVISLYFQLCYEDIVCLLGNHAGGERILHATFHDEMKQVYTYLLPICVDHRYVVVIGTVIAHDTVDSFRQCFDREGLSIDEGVMVNDLAPAPILLICNVHCCRIGLSEKG